MRWALVVCAMSGWLGGCSEPCVDHDNDGRGEHCGEGPDCNDDDPRVAGNCDASVPDCDDDRHVEGCSCVAGERASCYLAPEHTEGVGICRAGELRCADGYFTRCVGVVLPEDEVCNGQDDDCDGTTDEGVLSPCGGCSESCFGGVWGPPLSPFVPHGDLVVTDDGELTLKRTARKTHLLWVPNTDEGTVSKIDTESVKELARYRTAGAHPTRVAVDHAGNAWVLDTPPGARGVLTKLAGDRADCIAADGGEDVKTSSGPTDVLALGDDGCVLVSVPLGAASDAPTALAVDGARDPDGAVAGDVWVGMAGSHEVVHYGGATGERLESVSLPSFSPHTAAFDPWGTLWLADSAGLLASVDTSQVPPKVRIREVELACYALDGLAIDARGRVALTGFSCENVIVYDPVRDRFSEALAERFLTPRGIAVAGDDAWVAFTSGELGHVTLQPLAIDANHELTFERRAPFEATGVSLDSRGRVWVVGAMGGRQGNGLVTAFDPVREKVAAQLTVGRGPRALGDMTGTALGGELADSGIASHVFDGCGHESAADDAHLAGRQTAWDRVHIDASTPRGATIVVEGRRAEARAGLSAQRFVKLGTIPTDTSPLPVSFAAGGVVELRVHLKAGDALGAPRLRRVGLQWTCPGPE